MFGLMKLELHEMGHVAAYFTVTLELQQFNDNSIHLTS